MTDDLQPEPSEKASKAKPTRTRKHAAGAAANEAEAKAGTSGKRAPKSASKAPKTASAAKAPPKKKAAARRKAVTETDAAPAAARFEDPIGDTTDGEAWTYTGEELETEAASQTEAYRAGISVDAVDGTLESSGQAPQGETQEKPEAAPAKIAEEIAEACAREDATEARPQAKLERLQKILSQAGIASRRRAEEMIVAGRVIVNGQVVTALGSKADPEHDHIRVDGKLLHGAERHRYFLLNKPKGYVTTVSDPEGRPTVMDFVRKLGERVYPVGRLDFQSEGLLLMTNDGALANQLTRAASGVEKTYLVKVAGQPDEEDLERLRTGVMIERGGPASSGLYGAGGRVRTAPARIRQIRSGENPWYEVVLTEGRNRELRKMFSAVGHYVEKIRRVGYGPLLLDVEPGTLRELTPEEVEALRLAAEGKLRPRRIKVETMLPKDAGRTAEAQSARPYAKRGPGKGAQKELQRRLPERRPEKQFRGRLPEPRTEKEFRPRFEQQGERKDFRRRGGERGGDREFRPRDEQRGRPQARPAREFRGERRDWKERPRTERPARYKPGEARREFEPRRPERSSEAAKHDFGRRPAKSWREGQKPPRTEGLGREDRAHGRPGAAAKFPGRAGGGGGQGSNRGADRSKGPGRPGGFHSGPRRGGAGGGGRRRG